MALLAVSCFLLAEVPSPTVFVAGRSTSCIRTPRLARRAEESSSSSSGSSALVKVTEENSITTAGVLAGVVGLLVGGIWVGAGLFAASSYLARKKDDDVAQILKSVASNALEVVNFVGNLDSKYGVTAKVSDSIKSSVDSAKNSPDSKGIADVVGGLGDAITNFDKDVGIKDALGNVLTSSSELAAKAVDKVVELNTQYKVTDQLKEKIDSAIKDQK